MKNETFLFFSTVLLIVLVGCGRSKDEYKSELSQTRNKMVLSNFQCSGVIEGHLKLWLLAVESEGYTTVGEGIQKSLDIHKSSIEGIKESQIEIKKMMTELNDPPKDFERVYDKLMEAYVTYSSLSEAATSPSGSLLTYSREVKDLQRKLNGQFTEIKILLP